MAIAVIAIIALLASATLIPGLEMETRVNIAGTAGPIVSLSAADCARQFLGRRRNGGTAK